MIDEELISIKDITQTINSMEIENEIEKIVDRIVEGKLKTELTAKFPMLAMFLSDSIMAKIKTYLIEVINENRVELIELPLDNGTLKFFENYFAGASISSISKTMLAFGGITFPAPRSP